MVFNSFQFIWLFPIIFLLYYAISLFRNPKLSHNLGNEFLIITSYLLYFQWNAAWGFLLLGLTAVTYFGALLVDNKSQSAKRRVLIFTFAAIGLLPLLVFKYYDFVNFQVGRVLSAFNIANEIPGLNWVIPVGISFYTFQAVGYLFDVYYGRFKAERNWWDYMLFVSFFPQIMSGPISRAADLMPQIKQYRQFDYAKAVQGCKMLLWGFFLKLVFADNLGLVVDTIIPNYKFVSGGELAMGAIGYSLQIYGDFAGYSLIAIGVGRLMGFELINNFDRPYFSASITEFWKRWHISLTRWLTYNVYIPLGGSRCSKAKNYRNIMVTFLVSGLWHGASWTYIFWGFVHGLLQIVEKALGIQHEQNKYLRIVRIPIIFFIVTLLWIFFRVDTISDGFNVIAKIFTDFHGLSIMTLSYVAPVATVVVLFREWCNIYRPKWSLMNNRYRIVRWSVYIILFCTILTFGVLDASSFIYVSF